MRHSIAAESLHLGAHRGYFVLKLSYSGFELGNPRRLSRDQGVDRGLILTGNGRGIGRLRKASCDRLHRPAQQVSVARFLGAGLARQDGSERRRALGEFLETSKDVGNLSEGVKALSAAAQFARSLRATQQQNANERGFGSSEVIGLTKPVLVFGDAAIGVACAAGKTDVFKAAQGEMNFFLVKIGDWLAV